MARGGKRPGAGRKPGAATIKTREVADKAASEGITPLEYLLSWMRNESADEGARRDAAKAAAPFVHPKLATVDHKSTDGTMSPPDVVGIYQLPDNGR